MNMYSKFGTDIFTLWRDRNFFSNLCTDIFLVIHLFAGCLLLRLVRLCFVFDCVIGLPIFLIKYYCSLFKMDPPLKKRRIVYSDKSLKCEERKSKKVRGEKHLNTSGNVVDAKQFNLVTACCNDKCCNIFSLQEQCNIFDFFYNGQDKSLQDSFLSSCMSKSGNLQAKPNQKKPRLNTWAYSMKTDGVTQKVCQKFILSLFGISKKRLRVIQSKISDGVSFQERRGCHNNRPHKLKTDVLEVMTQHLESIPSDLSHYSAHKTTFKYFENPDLNVKILYEKFKDFYNEKTNTALRMSYVKYFKLFKEKFRYSFQRPKTDVCDFCADMKEKLSRNHNDPCNPAFQVHKRKVARRLSLKTEFISKATNEETDHLVVEFDYGQNYPIPRLNVNSQFYKRMLWLYPFNIHVYNDDSSFFYCHMENHAGKNGNSVVSFLYDCLKKLLNKPNFSNIKTVVLMSDATGGQNRNTTVTKFCVWFAKVHNLEVVHLYPVRGHSFSQCDRNFGLVRNKVKNKEVIGSARPWLEAIVTSRANPSPFDMIMDKSLIKDWESALAPFFLKEPLSKNKKYTIMKYMMMKYTSSGSLLCSENFVPMYSPFKYLSTMNTDLLRSITLQPVPLVPISEAKEKDVRSLLKFLPQEDSDWIEFVLNENN